VVAEDAKGDVDELPNGDNPGAFANALPEGKLELPNTAAGFPNRSANDEV